MDTKFTELQPPLASDVLRVHGPAIPLVPVVLDSPHSGDQRPPDFDCLLTDQDLRDAQDSHIDTLYLPATALGIPMLAAQYPRTYIDANRHEGDVDPELLDTPWPDLYRPSGKARLGKALIWRTLDDGRAIYSGRLSVQHIRWRIAHYHRPYHTALKHLLDSAHESFGCVYHINCHSMNPVSGLMGEGGAGSERADFVLGDRDGTTCSAEFTQFVQKALAQYGYEVAINQPYKGVELVRAYADPIQHRHSLQLEINKRIYMDMSSGQPNTHFPLLQQRLTQMLADMVTHFSSTGTP